MYSYVHARYTASLLYIVHSCSLTHPNPKLFYMCIVQFAAHKPQRCHAKNCPDLSEKVFLITCLMVQVQVRDFHLRTSICQSLQYLFIKHLLKTAFLMSSEHTLSQKWSDSRLKNRACYVWSCCNGICLVSTLDQIYCMSTKVWQILSPTLQPWKARF